ncbi:MAG: hypothetical protein AAFV01_17615, partial [Bacteroidota bacterium]
MSSVENAKVPPSLRTAWVEHRNNILSEDGTKIDIDFGACWDWERRRWRYEYFTVEQLREVTDAFVVSLLSAKVTSINLNLCVKRHRRVCEGDRRELPRARVAPRRWL